MTVSLQEPRLLVALPQLVAPHAESLGDVACLIGEWSRLLNPLAALRNEASSWTQRTWVDVAAVPVEHETINELRAGVVGGTLVSAVRSFQSDRCVCHGAHLGDQALPLLLGLAALAAVRAAVGAQSRTARDALMHTGLLQPPPQSSADARDRHSYGFEGRG